ncbi:unnamed protein product, partial [Mesorhabditis belari]|uniref:Uncharacterized protein n=1 Tax=Mesorhabditis belari TaxID=2138241 RepID=A0AAF3FN49_9BILA
MIYNGNGITIVLFGIYNSSIITTRPEFVPIYGFFILCEIVGFLFSFSIELIVVKIAFTCQTFHKNLLNAFGVFVAQHILSQAGRLVLMCYQFGVFKITGNLLLDLPLLIFSTYRVYLYVGAITFLSSLIIERFMATIYIKDYEKAFRKIHQSNSKSLASLLAHYELNQYSLSARFQLKENVRSMKVIEKIFYIHCAFCLFATALFTIPHVLYEESGEERELGIAALEAIQGM